MGQKESDGWQNRHHGGLGSGLSGSGPLAGGKRELVEFTYITFKSSSEILSATLGGHVALYGSTVDPATVPYLKEGRLRILTYLGTEKIPGYESIPSLQELYGFSIPNLMAVYGPNGIPEYALRKLDEGIAKVIKDPDFVSAMNRMYTPIVYMDRVQLNRYVEETLPFLPYRMGLREGSRSPNN